MSSSTASGRDRWADAGWIRVRPLKPFHLGRIAAVAVGVGTAVASMQAVAFADSPGPESGSSAVSGSSADGGKAEARSTRPERSRSAGTGSAGSRGVVAEPPDSDRGARVPGSGRSGSRHSESGSVRDPGPRVSGTQGTARATSAVEAPAGSAEASTPTPAPAVAAASAADPTTPPIPRRSASAPAVGEVSGWGTRPLDRGPQVPAVMPLILAQTGFARREVGLKSTSARAASAVGDVWQIGRAHV